MTRRDAIAELNRIARAELGRPKQEQHRHNWQTEQSISAARREGIPIVFTCECGKTKKVGGR
jgi:hypothetical protein